MGEVSVPDLVKETCGYLKEEKLPVSFDERTSTCNIRKSGGIEITATDGDIIVRNKNRDTLFVFTDPKEVERVIDIYHGENVVRIKGKEGVLEIRYPVVGDKRIRFVVSFDVDRDGSLDAAAVRVWK